VILWENGTEDTSCKKLLCIAAFNLEKTFKWVFLRNRQNILIVFTGSISKGTVEMHLKF
jgi:hypothetical protein